MDLLSQYKVERPKLGAHRDRLAGVNLRLQAAAALALLAACAACTPRPDQLLLRSARFDDLPGWHQDDMAAALAAFRASCGVIIGRSAGAGPLGLAPDDWAGVCAATKSIDSVDDASARQFFEGSFVPFQVTNHGEDQGLFTGYYEPELHGAETPSDHFATPLYRRPPDLISVDLGLFRPDLKGERIAGRLASDHLVPYATRTEIEHGALAGKGLELLWVDDPVDAFFLEIQGSGRVDLPDGRFVHVGYDGQNGRKYVAIGQRLADRGIPKDQIDMDFIRTWIASHGEDGRALMDENPSVVFFRTLNTDGPVGAEGAVLTPGRSAAIDHRFLPLGLPLWVDTSDDTVSSGRLQRLFVAQDTGGAIRGPVRADLFFGFGAEAAHHAGSLKGHGDLWLLVPRGAAKRVGS